MAKSAGRPPVGPRVAVRLPAELISRLDAAADAEGETRAATVRRLLEEGVAESGVDIAQIRRALALTPAARIREVAATANTFESIRNAARR